ncbi:hypothetical protein [Streptomyces sp. NPDC005953]|uniref:hypothetical protein n=1 Tax=Streptomyces sp. NPDC005953 TaxID=3156719 RepID=UPI0033D43FC0
MLAEPLPGPCHPGERFSTGLAHQCRLHGTPVLLLALNTTRATPLTLGSLIADHITQAMRDLLPGATPRP